MPGVVKQACNSSIWEGQVGGLLGTQKDTILNNHTGCLGNGDGDDKPWHLHAHAYKYFNNL